MNNQPELYGFQRYLMAKKTVDDRALNKDVFKHLSQQLAIPERKQLLEVGAGIGTMIQRLFEAVPFFDLDYTLMDVESENLAAVLPIFIKYANQHDLQMQVMDKDHFVLSEDGKQCRVTLLEGDLMALPDFNLPQWDGIIAHAVLDLLPLTKALPVLHAGLKPNGWLYSTINFDGLTLLEPVIDPELDFQIVRAYHESMDKRLVGEYEVSAGSLSGRKLFHALREHQFEIKAAGASDWFVFANHGKYPFDEAFFLDFILNFFEESVGKAGVVESNHFQRWLEQRRKQIKKGELTLITHQYDYFAARS